MFSFMGTALPNVQAFHKQNMICYLFSVADYAAVVYLLS